MRNNKGESQAYQNFKLESEIDAIAGAEVFDTPIQQLSSCVGGKVYRDLLTGQAFTPANLADGVVRVGTWATANSDWILYTLKPFINTKPANFSLFYNAGSIITTGTVSAIVGSAISDGTYRYMYFRICKAGTNTELSFQVINPFNIASSTGARSWFWGIMLTLNADKSVTITYDSTPLFHLTGLYLENTPRIVY